MYGTRPVANKSGILKVLTNLTNFLDHLSIPQF